MQDVNPHSSLVRLWMDASASTTCSIPTSQLTPVPPTFTNNELDSYLDVPDRACRRQLCSFHPPACQRNAVCSHTYRRLRCSSHPSTASPASKVSWIRNSAAVLINFDAVLTSPSLALPLQRIDHRSNLASFLHRTRMARCTFVHERRVDDHLHLHGKS